MRNSAKAARAAKATESGEATAPPGVIPPTQVSPDAAPPEQVVQDGAVVSAGSQSVDQRHAAVVTQACRLIESQGEMPDLDTLARSAGMSPSHFHRVFKAQTGLTPKAFASAHRARRLRAALNEPGVSVTEAIYDAGFNASSRFYEHADRLLGMRARNYRNGGSGEVIRFAVAQCSLGAILVAQGERGICAIMMDDDPEVLVRDLQDQFPKAQLLGGEEGFEQVVAQVVGMIEMPERGLQLPLDVRGTAFQERVWQALREIPPGSTMSYAEVAERIDAPRAVRAVANACASNRLAVAVPCHRVVRQDGHLSGYRWGVARKRELLRREGWSEPASQYDESNNLK